CHRQISRYTCPSCNVPYCSLTCFRSDAHSQCSEPFYKRELEDGIKSQPNASMEERTKMMDLLKRFEEEEGNPDSLNEEDKESAETDGLVERLGGVDLDELSSEDLWARLTPSERSAFLKAIRDPQSEGAQVLLRSKELEADLSRTSVLPWWEAQVASEEGEGTSDGQQDVPTTKRYGYVPQVMQLPASMMKAPNYGKDAPSLLYNVCAVLIAYAYVTRHLAFSPLAALGGDDPSENQKVSRDLLYSLLPFLTRKDARLVYSDLNEVITNLWAKLVATSKVSKEVFSLLLQDAVMLLQPQRVTEIIGASRNPTSSATSEASVDLLSSPSLNILRVLSDLMRLFNGGSNTKQKSDTHAGLKMRFYVAHVVMVGDSTGQQAFIILADALRRRAERVEMEGLVDDNTEIRVR
ncbi:hypothetical protein SCHPADRAFT_837775, partial [Schizopora paradoxa]